MIVDCGFVNKSKRGYVADVQIENNDKRGRYAREYRI